MRIHNVLFALAISAVAVDAAAAQITSNPVDDFVMNSHRGGGGRPRRGCGPLREPRVLPTLSEMADSAALTTAVATFARNFPIASDSLPFAAYTVTYGPGGVQNLRAMNYRLPQGQADAFASLVRRNLRSVGSAQAFLRLRIRISETPTFLIDNVERCRPELRTEFHMNTPRMAEYHAPKTLRMRVRVGENGQILSAHLTRSSGDLELDTWVQGVLQGSNALPGLIDGVPVEMDTEEDIRVRVN